ncbi:MAG: DUF6702 family protein [Pseudomonadota bacterium]
MTSFKRWLILCLALATCAAVRPEATQAHNSRFGLTTIEWDASSGTLEIVHRLHLGDALAAIEKNLGTGRHSFFGARSLAALGVYVEERFSIFDQDRQALVLDFIGAEVLGQDVLVYQEVKWPKSPMYLQVHNALLTDIQPRQVNQVNLITPTKTLTLIFESGSRLASFER